MIVSTLLLNNFSISYGDYAVAAFGISMRVAQISDFIGMGLFMGVIPLIAYSFTSGNIFLGLYGVIWSITISQVITCIIGLGLWIRFKKDPSMKNPALETQNNFVIN